MSENLQPETELTTRRRFYLNKKRALVLASIIIALSAASYLAIQIFFPPAPELEVELRVVEEPVMEVAKTPVKPVKIKKTRTTRKRK